MSAQRLAWLAVVVLVFAVGLLVLRSARTPGTAPAAVSAVPQEPSPEPAAEDTAGGQSPLSSIQRAKMVLKERGYYDGPMDSNIGPPLYDALKRFQKDAGMTPTGYLDDATYAALGIELYPR